MKTSIEKLEHLGNCLMLESQDIKVGIPLEFGLRISYLSYKGSENLFFVQPTDMSDMSLPNGWRVRGGHRLWTAPESQKHYYPDNDAISYEIVDDGVILSQVEDPWLKIQKSIEISFVECNLLKVVHKVKNTDNKTCTFSPWGVSSMAGGGTEYIPLPLREGGYDPLLRYSTWDYACLGDERLTYSLEQIKISHKPTGKKFKMGLGHPNGPVKYVNRGVVFEKIYDIFRDKLYPDGNVSFETFMCDHAVEVETLSPLSEVGPGQTATHTELWRLTKE